MSRQFAARSTINEKASYTYDLNNEQLFEAILIELKKMNMYLSMITDTELKEEDIE